MVALSDATYCRFGIAHIDRIIHVHPHILIGHEAHDLLSHQFLQPAAPDLHHDGHRRIEELVRRDTRCGRMALSLWLQRDIDELAISEPLISRTS